MGAMKNGLLSVPVGSVSVDLQAHGDRICSHLIGGGHFEDATRKFWAMLCCKPDAVVLDIGAYTGLYGIAAAKLGATAFLFEPMPDNLKRLYENVERNDAKGTIHVNGVAVADRVGEASIYYNLKVKGLTSGATLVSPRNDCETLKVKTITIDSLKLPRVDAIKVDVERGEAAVLRGAVETINRCRPPIIAEVLDATTEGGVRRAMLDINYKRGDVLDVRNWILTPL